MKSFTYVGVHSGDTECYRVEAENLVCADQRLAHYLDQEGFEIERPFNGPGSLRCAKSGWFFDRIRPILVNAVPKEEIADFVGSDD